MDVIEEYVRRVVDAAPPPSLAQIATLAALLHGAPGAMPPVPLAPWPSASVERYRKRRIEATDGESFTGRAAGMSRIRQPESVVRDQLARQINGVIEVKLPYGRADVMTKTHVFEVEHLDTYRAGIRQVLAYSVQAAVPPALAVFGRAARERVLKLYLELRDNKPKIELWWHDGWHWRHISSRTRCITMHDPLLGRADQPRKLQGDVGQTS